MARIDATDTSDDKDTITIGTPGGGTVEVDPQTGDIVSEPEPTSPSTTGATGGTAGVTTTASDPSRDVFEAPSGRGVTIEEAEAIATEPGPEPEPEPARRGQRGGRTVPRDVDQPPAEPEPPDEPSPTEDTTPQAPPPDEPVTAEEVIEASKERVAGGTAGAAIGAQQADEPIGVEEAGTGESGQFRATVDGTVVEGTTAEIAQAIEADFLEDNPQFTREDVRVIETDAGLRPVLTGETERRLAGAAIERDLAFGAEDVPRGVFRGPSGERPADVLPPGLDVDLTAADVVETDSGFTLTGEARRRVAAERFETQPGFPAGVDIAAEDIERRDDAFVLSAAAQTEVNEALLDAQTMMVNRGSNRGGDIDIDDAIEQAERQIETAVGSQRARRAGVTNPQLRRGFIAQTDLERGRDFTVDVEVTARGVTIDAAVTRDFQRREAIEALEQQIFRETGEHVDLEDEDVVLSDGRATLTESGQEKVHVPTAEEAFIENLAAGEVDLPRFETEFARPPGQRPVDVFVGTETVGLPELPEAEDIVTAVETAEFEVAGFETEFARPPGQRPIDRPTGAQTVGPVGDIPDEEAIVEAIERFTIDVPGFETEFARPPGARLRDRPAEPQVVGPIGDLPDEAELVEAIEQGEFEVIGFAGEFRTPPGRRTPDRPAAPQPAGPLGDLPDEAEVAASIENVTGEVPGFEAEVARPPGKRTPDRPTEPQVVGPIGDLPDEAEVAEGLASRDVTVTVPGPGPTAEPERAVGPGPRPERAGQVRRGRQTLADLFPVIEVDDTEAIGRGLVTAGAVGVVAPEPVTSVAGGGAVVIGGTILGATAAAALAAEATDTDADDILDLVSGRPGTREEPTPTIGAEVPAVAAQTSFFPAEQQVPEDRDLFVSELAIEEPNVFLPELQTPSVPKSQLTAGRFTPPEVEVTPETEVDFFGPEVAVDTEAGRDTGFGQPELPVPTTETEFPDEDIVGPGPVETAPEMVQPIQRERPRRPERQDPTEVIVIPEEFPTGISFIFRRGQTRSIGREIIETPFADIDVAGIDPELARFLRSQEPIGVTDPELDALEGVNQPIRPADVLSPGTRDRLDQDTLLDIREHMGTRPSVREAVRTDERVLEDLREDFAERTLTQTAPRLATPTTPGPGFGPEFPTSVVEVTLDLPLGFDVGFGTAFEQGLRPFSPEREDRTSEEERLDADLFARRTEVLPGDPDAVIDALDADVGEFDDLLEGL